MVSNRIRLIASLLNKSDKVLDVGTDHALLPIYLKINNMVDLVDASDISPDVLKNAKENIMKFNLSDDINLILSDGLENVDVEKYNTWVICGMGFFTIKDILANANLKSIKKMIIQTNNRYSDFREFVGKIGFKIQEEIWICDHGIDYLIFELVRGQQILSSEEICCGIYSYQNLEYYQKEILKYEYLLNEVPKEHYEKRSYISYMINTYKSYLSRERIEEKRR